MNQAEILAKVSKGELSAEDATALLEKSNETALHFKVGEKGGVSVYGLNARFPVTLYRRQWERLIAAMPELASFIEANGHRLKDKKAA